MRSRSNCHAQIAAPKDGCRAKHDAHEHANIKSAATSLRWQAMAEGLHRACTRAAAMLPLTLPSPKAATGPWQLPSALTTPSGSAVAVGVPPSAASQSDLKGARGSPARGRGRSGVTEGRFRHRHITNAGNTAASDAAASDKASKTQVR
jgi:hypothetical protein